MPIYQCWINLRERWLREWSNFACGVTTRRAVLEAAALCYLERGGTVAPCCSGEWKFAVLEDVELKFLFSRKAAMNRIYPCFKPSRVSRRLSTRNGPLVRPLSFVLCCGSGKQQAFFSTLILFPFYRFFGCKKNLVTHIVTYQCRSFPENRCENMQIDKLINREINNIHPHGWKNL